MRNGAFVTPAMGASTTGGQTSSGPIASAANSPRRAGGTSRFTGLRYFGSIGPRSVAVRDSLCCAAPAGDRMRKLGFLLALGLLPLPGLGATGLLNYDEAAYGDI